VVSAVGVGEVACPVVDRAVRRWSWGRAAHRTAGLPAPQGTAFGAAARLGSAEALTRGPLSGLGRAYGQDLRPRLEWRAALPRLDTPRFRKRR